MPILFSAVAFKKTIQFRYASCDGNFDEIVENVIDKISSDDNKMTYYHRRYLLHFIMESNNFYFCITDKLCQRSRAFLFLNEIKRRYSTNKEHFTNTLSEQMFCYNDDGSTITIREGDIDEINSIGVDSSESLLGEKILIVRNDNNLRYSITSYEATPRPEKVEISFTKSNYSIYLIASLVVAVGLFVCSPASFVIVILIAILYAIVR